MGTPSGFWRAACRVVLVLFRIWARAAGRAMVWVTLGLNGLFFTVATLALSQLPYDTEYEAIPYSTAVPADAVARLQERINNDQVQLDWDSQRGYLDSLLRELKVPVASQVLVFSKTSLQTGLISARTPRAIYFNDQVYVAWAQQSELLEISSVEADLGAVFYTLSQEQKPKPQFERQLHLCLQCHDSFSLTGGGVPRHILGAGFADQQGRLIAHEGWHLTTDQTPLNRRWGGWYVTGTHGDQVHMGNLVPRDASHAVGLNLSEGGNLTDLGSLIDVGPYLGKHSDIVALLVIEHQVSLQNLIIRVNYDSRMALHRDQTSGQHGPSGDTLKRIQNMAEALVETLLFVGEAPLTSRIQGTSGFAEQFESRGPWDGQGRSLRQLDLTRRLFEYPCSFLIYSREFEGLPQLTRRYIYRRLWEVFDGSDRSERFSHLSDSDREALREILEQTKPAFSAARPARSMGSIESTRAPAGE